MILSSIQELINDKICLDSAEIELILYNKLRAVLWVQSLLILQIFLL